MGGSKKSAVDRVIAELEAEKVGIEKTIARPRAAQSAAAKPKRPKTAAAPARAGGE